MRGIYRGFDYMIRAFIRGLFRRFLIRERGLEILQFWGNLGRFPILLAVFVGIWFRVEAL